MQIAISLGLLTGMLLTSTANTEDQKERSLNLLNGPESVHEILKLELGNAKLIPSDLRAIDPVAVYISYLSLGELESAMMIRADGNLVNNVLGSDGDQNELSDADEGQEDDSEEIEVHVSMEDLPRAVRRTLKRESRGGEIKEIELEIEGDRIVYEAEVVYEMEDRELEYEIRISLDGILLSKILEDHESDDDEDEDEEDQGDDEGDRNEEDGDEVENA